MSKMPAYSDAVAVIDRHSPDSDAEESAQVRRNGLVGWTYVDLVPTDPNARRVAFGNFVRRALDHARTSRGWTVEKVAEESDVAESTIYRWQKGDWRGDPLPRQIKSFCDALDIPTSAVFAILWPNKDERAPEPIPLAGNPDVEILLRRLADPNVPDAEKYLIRETLRGLASRPARPPREDVG